MLWATIVRLNKIHGIRFLKRFYSTRLTYAQNMFPQEFSLESYNCIGFDLDHTLCQYKLKPLFNLIYKTLASFMIEKYDYPRYLLNLSEVDMTFAQKGIVMDKKRGNFLKLDSGYRIVKVNHGTKSLSKEDIEQIYGKEWIWEDSKGIPHDLVENYFDCPFYIFKDYFVTVGAIICAKMVDISDERNIKDYSVWDQYLEALLYMYDKENFKDDSGIFFPTIKSNPAAFMKPCSENFKSWLSELRKDKIVFLLTGANHDSAEFNANFSLGSDWKKYFDLIVTFARKPGFFWKDKPFLELKDNCEGGRVLPNEMKPNFVYSQGNFKELREVLSNFSKTENPKILYIGDSLIEDIYAASEIGRCDTVAILEELLAEEMENVDKQHSESEILLSERWGSFFSNEPASEHSEGNLSLWAHLLSQYSKLAIPNVESIMTLSLNEKTPCFGSDSRLSGYYPGVPKALASN